MAEATHKKCDVCHKSKAANSKYFPSKNRVLGSTCRVCVAKATKDADPALNKAIEDRRRVREDRKIRKAAERKAAKDAAAEKRRRQKEKRAAALKKTATNEELASRVLARRRLLAFTKRFHKTYDAGWVHKVICAKLEQFSKAVANKESPRLMVFMPPRAGKSELASKNFPAWHLGQYPQHEIIASSYAVSLPLDFSLKIKRMLRTKAYQSVFPNATLDPDAQATDGWYTTEGGGYVPAGVGGGITGKGAHILIIDDPVKDAAEADSESQRQKVWDWWDSTAETRLAPGGGVLVIQTRWHDDDLAGRMLRHMVEAQDELKEEREENEIARREGRISQAQYAKEAKRLDKFEEEIISWEVVTFPALAEEDEWMDSEHNLIPGHIARSRMDENVYDLAVARRQKAIEDGATERGTSFRATETNGLGLLRIKGEALHPARYDELFFRRKKRGSQPRFWSALYQQNPVPDEGVYFHKQDFRYEASVPDYSRMNVYVAFDLAIGLKQVNDWTVGLIAGHDEFDRIHILDMVRVRTDALAELIVDTCKPYKDKISYVGLERGQIQMSVMPSLEKEMTRQRVFFAFDDELRPVTDKTARAKPAQARMQRGHVLLPQNQPWVEVFTSELLRFPGGLHDDIVDALAWLVRMIERQHPPKPTVKKQKRKEKTVEQKVREMMRGKRGSGAMAA